MIMMDDRGRRFKYFCLAMFVLLLASCVRMGATVGPVSQYVLRERSLQPEVLPQGLWTMSFEYRFEAQTLSMDSTLTLHNPGIKRVRLMIIFVDADNRALGETTLLNVSAFPTNPIITHHELPTPAGTVAIAFRGATRGGRPVD
jgi:hypothetical protein